MHDVRDARSAVEGLPVTVFVMVVAVVSPERELDLELDVVVMEGKTVLDSAYTGESLDEMGEGGKWWMVGKFEPFCACEAA